MKIDKFKIKIRQFVNHNPYFINFIYILIICNISALILESYKGIRTTFGNFFYYFEVFSVIIFTIEYFLRVWASKPSNGNSSDRFHFAFSAAGIIDLLAILPFYLPFIFPFDLRVLRILRLLRIFKLGRYSKSMKTLKAVYLDVKSDLATTVFVTFVLMVLSSTLMYYIEHDVQPEKFTNIGDAFWWSIATLTTVGYGDIYPVTALGKFLSGTIALIGIGFVAIPTGILSSSFINKIQSENKKQKKSKTCNCPHCGKEIKL